MTIFLDIFFFLSPSICSLPSALQPVGGNMTIIAWALEPPPCGLPTSVHIFVESLHWPPSNDPNLPVPSLSCWAPHWCNLRFQTDPQKCKHFCSFLYSSLTPVPTKHPVLRRCSVNIERVLEWMKINEHPFSHRICEPLFIWMRKRILCSSLWERVK